MSLILFGKKLKRILLLEELIEEYEILKDYEKLRLIMRILLI
jgi:hypothetical protein